MTGALVWFKRDLRVRDHAALAAARHFEAVAGLVVIEPQWLESPECDPRHVEFFLDSVRALQRALAELGLPLLVRKGDVIDVLQDVRREFAFSHLFSHEETGTGWSYARDVRVDRVGTDRRRSAAAQPQWLGGALDSAHDCKRGAVLRWFQGCSGAEANSGSHSHRVGIGAVPHRAATSRRGGRVGDAGELFVRPRA